MDYDEIYSDDNMKPSDRNVPNVPEYYFEDINNHEEMLEFTQYNNGNWGCSGQASFYDLIGRERKWVVNFKKSSNEKQKIPKKNLVQDIDFFDSILTGFYTQN